MRLSDSKLFEGPCLSVNAILAVAGLKEVTPFADDLMRGDLQANSSDVKHPLRLVAAKDREERVDRCARVGLTLKKKDSPALRQQFIGAPYRFLTNEQKYLDVYLIYNKTTNFKKQTRFSRKLKSLKLKFERNY